MTKQSLKWRIPLVAFIVALALVIVYPPFDPDAGGPKEGKLKLGLDLQGGMHLVLRVKTETLSEEQREGATERALEVIRNRIDQFGVSEPLIQRQGKDQLVLQLPGITDRERALALVGKTALLEFRILADDQTIPEDPQGLQERGLVAMQHENGSVVVLEDRALLTGKMLKDASVQYETQWGEPVVALSFNADGSKIFGDITTQNVGKQLAIILDSVVQSAPVINEPILSGDAQISGQFKLQDASDLAIALRAGALPAPIEIQEERTIGPTLGQDSVRQGIRATLLAGALVLTFMTVYYLFCGLVANVALILNILIIGGALAYFRGTLTVPGIAGVILTIGMAVDTNVLILERIREEHRLGKSVSASIASGYKKAFSAIFDSNLTTLLTALILFQFGTGPVRGFALTLAIGIVGSFFSGIFVTRVIFDAFALFRPYQSLPMLAFLKHVPHIPFMTIRKIMVTISVVAVIGGLIGIFIKAEDRLGVDFSGGTVQELRFEKPVEIQEVRSALVGVGLENAIIQEFGDPRDLVIRSPLGTNDAVYQAIGEQFKDNAPERIRVETVGPVIGQELRKKALTAMLGSLVMILIYLSIRFEFRYSVGAIAALFHDAILCLAIVILSGRELSVPVLAALLTIVGYSVNDTIVIFDRVRENVRRGLKRSFEEIINQSINESLARTILTSLTTLLVVGALYVFGGPVINDFAFTMIIGVIIGTYSSVYVASPVIVDWVWKKKLK